MERYHVLHGSTTRDIWRTKICTRERCDVDIWCDALGCWDAPLTVLEIRAWKWCDFGLPIERINSWLIGCPFSANIFVACLGGEYSLDRSLFKRKEAVKCLAYLHEHGAVWTSEVTRLAAQLGELECLAYAHEHGCPWDESVYFAAISGRKKAVLRYAQEHGCAY